ncbi:MAG: DUF4230 domain-containing protein [Muribaculaceae bacterium]|nr:DUF4230 domain-containing protein [Muribaculaceae bacterium]
MNTAKILKWATLLLGLLLLTGGIIWFVIWFNKSGEEVPVAKIEEAKVIDIRPMVKLCSVELSEDVPVRGDIGTRHLFARATLKGTISFDLEKAASTWEGDTLVVILPPEIVSVYESTDPNSYKVIDLWNDKFLGSSNFTVAEENKIKRQAVEAWRDTIYSRGYVERARSEAVRNLGMMLRPLTVDKMLRIVDPTPKGSRGVNGTGEGTDMKIRGNMKSNQTPDVGKE